MAAPKKIKTQPSATVQNFPVVGIGASAGGLDAFKRLLTVIPESSGMAYVLVQHLDPSHESFLPEILQRVTKIPVFEITEDIHLAPNNIYIIPSNKILISTDGVLQLSPRNKKTTNFSIDIFFTSLAEVHKKFAVGVVLSGTGSDGTQGLKAIKEYGGICIAQDKESAAYDSMPQSAIHAGVVDFILAPEKIPEQLLQINSAYNTSQVYKVEKQLVKDDDIFKQIILLLRQRSGVDFAYYKQQTLQRRIARRSALVKKKNITSYLEFLSSNTAEQDALFQDVLIPVTSFFRDPKTFQALTETVFPTFLKNKNDDAPIRIWISGCSTGEEAYSIAICLDEFLGEKAQNKKIQIFASDISEKAIKIARAGVYTKADVEILSASRIQNYFTKNGDGYEVSKHIRDMCVIAPHNFLKDPPFAKMDLISCRNVLIYMDTFLQKKAFATFHYALKENGFLLLGKSETVGASSDLFTQVEKNEKIYSRKPTPGRFTHVPTERKDERMTTKDKSATKIEVKQTDFRKSAEAIMISRSPASVIVNEQLDIVHIHGDITPFLQVPQGKPTHNLVKMAREGLGFELRNAIHKASKEQITITKLDIPVKTNATMNDEVGREKQFLVAIEIIPLTDTVERHYLIRFEKTAIPAHQEEKLSLSGKTKIDLAEKHNEQLEKELAHIREDMRSITEDMEASNEELQSANEELQSSNEEMQSLNEELETSKEELQSTNEELIIVNQELLDKQEQFNTARYYAESIVTTIREPLIVLDKRLCIKTANASFYKKFNTEEQDTEGKLFYEIQNHQWDDNLMRSLLEKILPERERLTDFEISLNFPSIGKRTLLLNALQIINEKNSEKLILLAIEDITERKLAEQKLKTFAEELEKQVKERTAALHKSNEELKQSNSHLDQFANVASHDLQEPLRKILTFSNRLQDKHQNEMSTEVLYYLNKIQGASSRMRTLIQDLLNYSRLLQHEKIFSTTDLNETVKNVLNDFDLLIEEKKAKITIDYLPMVDAVPVQMNQLFYNLISNALKFSKTDVPPVINITSRILSEKEVEKYPSFNPSIPYVEIIFKDNGIGFEQQYAKQIFIIFQRLHDKETYIGTGIGLALCKKIIENHHGEIFSNSKENEGAFFHVILPLIQPQ
ncbi:chemotaxis protein CheB [Flavobacterium frigoris]|uniref:Two-component system, chemotaxis family, CheB/CheR fusion protein n=1 Tax=Flavobacterium frigoris TaxID=229204 RepID=A0A1H9KRW3_FLAFI|nr:chemotaxis protein CheB [Flavobacterium frigoris]SER01890.1 two-component system, chemotaxis family, CheB/CheR fusion protein [Flavobacterium frigoris]